MESGLSIAKRIRSPREWMVRHHRGILLGAFVLATAARDPRAMADPTFMAEEGSRFYVGAFVGDWVSWLTRPYQGYYSLVPNAACGAAAHLLPVETAPYLTVLVAFLIQVLPAILLLWSRSPAFSSGVVRGVGTSLLLLAPGSWETWLSTIMSHFYFAIAGAIVLVEDVKEGLTWRRKWFLRAVLLIAGLNGVISCFLLPVFLWKAFRTRRGEDLVRAGILAACALVQVGMVLAYEAGGDGAGTDPLSLSARARSPTPAFFGLLAVSRVIGPALIGEQQVAGIFSFLARDATGIGIAPLAIGWILFLLCGVGFWRLAGLPEERLLLLAVLCGLVPTVVFAALPASTLFAPGVAPRYFMTLASILLLAIVPGLLRDPSRKRIRSRIAGVMCGTAMASGAWDFVRLDTVIGQGPRWRDEVAIWLDDPEHLLRIPPRGFTVKLVPRDRRSARVSTVGGSRSLNRPEAPILEVSTARLGDKMSIRVHRCPPGLSGKFLVRQGPAGDASVLSGFDEPLFFVNPASQGVVMSGFLAGADGVWTVELPLHSHPNYVGQVFTMQAVFGDPVVEVTNAVEVNLGS